MLARRLWVDNADLAQAALAHSFVRGLANGALPLQQFQFYVAQDAFFLEAFARGYAFGLARSPDRDGPSRPKRWLRGRNLCALGRVAARDRACGNVIVVPIQDHAEHAVT
jgi:pyrroloquinoline quinone (PQQ) biosynthesis protein C